MRWKRQADATLIQSIGGYGGLYVVPYWPACRCSRNLVTSSVEAKTDARQEGDLSLAVLRLDTESYRRRDLTWGARRAKDCNLDFATRASADGSRQDVALAL